MTRKLLIYSLLMVFSFVFASNTYGQQWIYFEGYVTDIDEGTPISEQSVFISDEDTLLVMVAFTNASGYYFDSLFMVDTEEVTVSTLDCDGLEHFAAFPNPDTLNRADFAICTGDLGCQAFYIYQNDESFPMLLYFMDFSDGEAHTWLWDFGDGNFSAEQNPSHEYMMEGLYEVCLTIENEDSNCSSTYCDFVYAGQNECWSDFDWELSNDNPFEVSFTDKSEGEISIWQWDFGDGTFSEEQSPVHQYPGEGEYWVGLLVTDSMGSCDDESWQLIYIYDDTLACKADFNFVLDTLNNTPFVYFFEDKSEGKIEEWFWEFGDGQTSNEHYPQHIYQDGGTYEVCLTISSSPAGGKECFNRICQTLSTPDYFNFGGQVFIDGFTINIDSTDKDNIAKAYLYRRVDNQWWYMDQREFWKYGYYWFANKPEGEYLVRADLMKGSLDFDEFAPSYYKESLNWQYANTFLLTNNDEFAVNIDLTKLQSFNTGIASLSGYLEVGVGCSYSIQMENQLVELFNAANQIIAYTYTDESGYFSFSGLAFETYGIKAEFTGNASTFLNLQPDAENPSISDIELLIDCNSFVGVDEHLSANSFSLESVFPNPAVDFVSLKVNAQERMTASIFVYDMNGQIIFEKNVNLTQGSQQFVLRVSTFNPGLYLLKLVSSDGKSISSQKLIINH